MVTTFNVVARYRTLEGKAEEVLALLDHMAEASRNEPGNLSYDFFRGWQDDRQIIILESYRAAADFEIHRNSAHFQQIGAERILPMLESRTVSTHTADN
ncbi:putative quinol monooxygenase [Paenarthrobacter sp. YAF11_1]|uniref:putative quinol monooxygenase n=1 Tax=Paenarthrobacter sp. YAF11_1 TaxID=3233074 RepID=UPI003F95B726